MLRILAIFLCFYACGHLVTGQDAGDTAALATNAPGPVDVSTTEMPFDQKLETFASKLGVNSTLKPILDNILKRIQFGKDLIAAKNAATTAAPLEKPGIVQSASKLEGSRVARTLPAVLGSCFGFLALVVVAAIFVRRVRRRTGYQHIDDPAAHYENRNGKSTTTILHA